MSRSRLFAIRLSWDEAPVGRLCRVRTGAEILDFDYDSAERIMTFILPSASRPRSIVHVAQVDVCSCECLCSCEAFKDYREASRMPYNRRIGGVYLEQLARAKGKPLLPLVTRPPRFLCPHMRKVQGWLKRHEYAEGSTAFEYLRFLEGRLTERAEAMPVRRAA